MSKDEIINETLEILHKLPEQKANEVRLILTKYYEKMDEDIFERGFEKLVNESESYDFLNEEEEVYTVNDVIEKYNAKG